MENVYSSGFLTMVGLCILSLSAAAVLGFWLGGWYQSERLQSELLSIADINPCY